MSTFLGVNAKRVWSIMLLLLCGGTVLIGPALGQSSGAAVTVVPGEGLVDSQFVAVSFSGLPASQAVRIRQCPEGATKAKQCNKDSPYAPSLRVPGDHRMKRTSSTGSGDVSFIVRAGGMKDLAGGRFSCNFKHACNIVVFELDQSTLKERGIDSAAATPIPFARSTVACKSQEGARNIAGSGSSSVAAAVGEWQSETCGEPLDLSVSYIVTNSPQGKESYLAGLTDSEFAISGIPLRDEEKKTLTDAGREAVQVPIATGSLSFIYNYWEDFDRCDSDTTKQRVTTMRMSAETLAYVMTGRLSDMSDPRIAGDNPDLVARVREFDNDGNCVTSNTLPGRFLFPVARADASSATWILSSWMLANAHDAWASAGAEFQEPTEIFPSYNGVVLRTGSDAVARQIRTPDQAQGTGEVLDGVWIGSVDTSVSRRVALPSVAVRNAAGQYVAPTTESVVAALQAATLNADGTVTPNYAATAPTNQYPLPVISHLMADKNKLTKKQAEVLKAFGAYAITTGQSDAEKRGYVPLPSEMATSAAASLEQIQGVGGGGGGDDDADPVDGSPPVSGGLGGAASAGGGSPLGPLTDDMLSGVAGGSGGGGVSLTSGPSGSGDGETGPIEGALAAEKLGAAGGPAGVVRALTVVLGVPMLIALGLASIVGGRTLAWRAAQPDGVGFRALLERRMWRRAT